MMKFLLAVLVALFVAVPASAQTSEPDTAFLVLNPRVFEPTPMHLAIESMVASCIGVESFPHFVWATADTIVGDPSARIAYGVTVFSEGQDPLIILDRIFALNPTIISHEIVHGIARVPEGNPLLTRCMMYTGVGIGPRSVSPAELDSLRVHAYVIHRHVR